MEAKVLGADDRAQNLEYQLFQKLRDETLREIEPIQQTADAIAVLDVLSRWPKPRDCFGIAGQS
jgi:Mismatch repair ATPase (MutS family)